MTGFKSVRSLADNSLHVSYDIVLALGAFQVGNAHPQQFLAGVAGHRAIRVINLDQPSLGVHNIETVQCSLRSRSKMLVMLSQCLSCFPALPLNFETVQCKPEVQRQFLEPAGSNLLTKVHSFVVDFVSALDHITV